MICVFFLYYVVYDFELFFCFFFKQKTAYEVRISDWSSDVCSSDLRPPSAVRYHVRGCVRGNALAPEGAARTDEGGTGVGRHMSESVRRMNMIETINSAMDAVLERDPRVKIGLAWCRERGGLDVSNSGVAVALQKK